VKVVAMVNGLCVVSIIPSILFHFSLLPLAFMPYSSSSTGDLSLVRYIYIYTCVAVGS